VVIIDTGSTDRTIEIARSMGGRVLEEPCACRVEAPGIALLPTPRPS
jgi:hypothetical protein